MNKHLLAIAAVTALAGCAVPPPPPQAAGEDLNVGIAKSCTATPVDFGAGNTAAATITMTNDGWCAVHVKQKDGQPFLLGLLRGHAEHGRVLVQKIGGETRIEYAPETRYVGADRFTVALRATTPNLPDATIQVMVNVSMGENMAPPPAATPAPATPARRTTPTRARQ